MHELTQLLRNNAGAIWCEDYDKVIRQWLEGRAVEINKSIVIHELNGEVMPCSDVLRILGLTEKEPEMWCKEHITERNNWFVTKSGKKIEIQDDWMFCPICGAPRPGTVKPTPPPRIEKLKEDDAYPHYSIPAMHDKINEIIDRLEERERE